MPRPTRSNPGPRPHVMTWAKATPVLAVCVLFDIVRAFFEMFWFFGPLAISVGVSTWIGGTLGNVAGTVAGVAAATPVARGVLELFGVIMAMAIALAGWLTVGIWLLVTNIRIFRSSVSSKVHVMGGLLVSGLPVLGFLPAMTFTVGRLYRGQIKREKVALKKWEVAQAAFEQEAHQQFQLQLASYHEVQMQRRQAANDNEEIPEEVVQAA